MIKLEDVKIDNVRKEMRVSLFADTKTEVVNDPEFDERIPGYKIAMGSDVLTATGDIAFMRSDGGWSWL